MQMQHKKVNVNLPSYNAFEEIFGAVELLHSVYTKLAPETQVYYIRSILFVLNIDQALRNDLLRQVPFEPVLIAHGKLYNKDTHVQSYGAGIRFTTDNVVNEVSHAVLMEQIDALWAALTLIKFHRHHRAFCDEANKHFE